MSGGIGVIPDIPSTIGWTEHRAIPHPQAGPIAYQRDITGQAKLHLPGAMYVATRDIPSTIGWTPHARVPHLSRKCAHQRNVAVEPPLKRSGAAILITQVPRSSGRAPYGGFA